MEAPPGGRILTADEAAHKIAIGNHKQSAKGSVEVDAALIELVRSGRVVAAEFADGTLAFQSVES